MKVNLIIGLAFCGAILTGCSKEDKSPTRNLLGQEHLVVTPEPTPPPTTPTPNPEPTKPTPLNFPAGAKFYILAGQSNMSGEEAQPYFDADPNVIMSGYPHGNAGEGYAFGLVEQSRKGVPIVLIQCAVGGTSMAQQFNLFSGCMDFIRTNNITVDGLVFAQGEQDATFNYESNWASQFTQYVGTVRSQLNNQNLPIVFTQIGQYGNNPPPVEYDYIKDQQMSVALTKVMVVQTDDLVPTCGGWHYCRDEAEVIGRRLADAMDSL